jgi:hypothetical protein
MNPTNLTCSRLLFCYLGFFKHFVNFVNYFVHNTAQAIGNLRAGVFIKFIQSIEKEHRIDQRC